MSVLRQRIQNLRTHLSEAVTTARPGTMIGWRTPQGYDFGVVVDKEGKDLICLSVYDRHLRKDKAMSHYRDEALTDKLGTKPLAPGIVMDVQRVPMHRAHKTGRMAGQALQPYLVAAAKLKTEDHHRTGGEVPMYAEQVEKLQEIRESLEGDIHEKRIRMPKGGEAHKRHREYEKWKKTHRSQAKKHARQTAKWKKQHKSRIKRLAKTARAGYRRVAAGEMEGVFGDEERQKLLGVLEQAKKG